MAAGKDFDHHCTVEDFHLADVDGDLATDLVCHDPPGRSNDARTWIALTRYW